MTAGAGLAAAVVVVGAHFGPTSAHALAARTTLQDSNASAHWATTESLELKKDLLLEKNQAAAAAKLRRSVQARADRAHRAALEAARPRWALPLYSGISSPYGYRWGGFHSGVDFVASYGTPVHAAGDGYVVAPNDGTSGYGLVVCIAHSDGSRTWYAHLSKSLVNVGQHVNAGDVIALSGASGEVTGPHMHFEVRYGLQTIDPLPWLRQHGLRI